MVKNAPIGSIVPEKPLKVVKSVGTGKVGNGHRSFLFVKNPFILDYITGKTDFLSPTYYFPGQLNFLLYKQSTQCATVPKVPLQ
jgi:hypothetical protein